MRLVSVNIGEERAIEFAKSSGKTGIYKMPANGPVKVTSLGIPGDAIVDTKHHGGYDQAVYLYGVDDYAWWAQELGAELEPGTFGENLTIAGLESADYCAGDCFSIGSVVLQVTAPRAPCVTLSSRMGDPHFINRFIAAGRPGLYCRVIQEGSLQSGDEVILARYVGRTVTIPEMFHYFYEKTLPVEYLQRYLEAPTPAKGREKMETRLREQLAARS